jgi:hypothetical protein
MAKQSFVTGQVLTAAQMTSLQQTAMLGGAASAKTASYTLVAADAGTAISMSNAGATTITVNTALFAAGDTVQITNLGAGVCTITAGTATVNSSASLALAQYESGTLYFTSTSAAIFIKGAGAAAGGGGMTEIASGSLSSTSVVLSSIDQTYRHLFLYVKSAQVSALTLMIFRLNGNTSGIYTEKGFVLNDTTWRNNTNQVYFSPATQAVNIPTTSNNDTYSLYIEEYTQTAYKNITTSMRDSASGGADSYNTFNDFGSTTAITSITIAGSNGTSTFSAGTYALYGVK